MHKLKTLKEEDGPSISKSKGESKNYGEVEKDADENSSKNEGRRLKKSLTKLTLTDNNTVKRSRKYSEADHDILSQRKSTKSPKLPISQLNSKISK